MMRHADDDDLPDHIAGKATLIALAAGGPDQAPVFVEAQGGNGDTGKLGQLSDREACVTGPAFRIGRRRHDVILLEAASPEADSLPFGAVSGEAGRRRDACGH